MTPQHTTVVSSAAATGAMRVITEIGPFVGATSFAVGSGLVFVSADGTWGPPGS